MTENRNADITSGECCLYFLGIGKCTSFFVTFGDDNNVARFLSDVASFNHFKYVAFLSLYFWYDNSFSTCGNAAVECNKTCFCTHNLNKKHPVVCACRIPDLIYSFNDCVERSVVTYSEVSSKNVIVYGSGDPYKRNVILFIEYSASVKGTISADDYDTIYLSLPEVIICLVSALWCSEFLAPCSFKYCSAPLDYIAYTA